MIRTSATELETFRLFLEGDFIDQEELLSRLRGERTENLKMRAGTAFHAFLENAGDFSGDEVEQDGFVFLLKLKTSIALPVIREVKTERGYLLDGQEVVLVAKADALNGRTVWDHKLSDGFDADRYTDSLQWRAYLSLFGCNTFTYNVFEGGEVKKKKQQRAGKVVWSVDELHQFSCHRYPGMDQELSDWVRELTRFIVKYVPERIDAPEAIAKKLAI